MEVETAEHGVRRRKIQNTEVLTENEPNFPSDGKVADQQACSGEEANKNDENSIPEDVSEDNTGIFKGWNMSVVKDLVDCATPSLPIDSAKKMLEEGLNMAHLAKGELEKLVGELGLDELAASAGATAASAGAMAAQATEQAEEFVRKVWEASWKVCNFQALPKWLQDNDFLHRGHRPPLPSFTACFKSIFRIHTETGNIWTHMLGCAFFTCLAIYVLLAQSALPFEERWVFAAFFAGAILCLGFSFTFHTVHCHSETVLKLFSKLDYVGIAMLIMGSFVPWLYYGFYCDFQPKIIYLTVVIVLGISAIIVSLWDKFGEPEFRPLRAGIFIAFGLSGVFPSIHYAMAEGWINPVSQETLGWLVLMGFLYILGAVLYANRVPERFFPGKFDIWFHSHQIFHVLVVAGACVHYHGMTNLAMHRLTAGSCPVPGAEDDIAVAVEA